MLHVLCFAALHAPERPAKSCLVHFSSAAASMTAATGAALQACVQRASICLSSSRQCRLRCPSLKECGGSCSSARHLCLTPRCFCPGARMLEEAALPHAGKNLSFLDACFQQKHSVWLRSNASTKEKRAWAILRQSIWQGKEKYSLLTSSCSEYQCWRQRSLGRLQALGSDIEAAAEGLCSQLHSCIAPHARGVAAWCGGRTPVEACMPE